MKFRVTMKDPDGVQDSLDDAALTRATELASPEMDADERKSLVESSRTKVGEAISKWFEYGEYLTVEIDTEAKTCVVVPK